MRYEEETVLRAFDIYAQLAAEGRVGADVQQLYKADDDIRGLVDAFAGRVDCVNIIAGDELIMIPHTRLSPFHANNDELKRQYLRSGATNADLYLMYFATLVLLGSFYDSYQTTNPTRDFISVEQWSEAMQERLDVLREHGEEALREREKEFSYNWVALLEKWDAMDDIKESARKQSGNTISRLSFLDTTRRFLEAEEIVEEIGAGELTLTEKAKTIVQRYFMEVDYNRGILEFLYGFEPDDDPDQEPDKPKEESAHAVDL